MTITAGRKNTIIPATVSFGGALPPSLGLVHAHVAIFLRHHAQALAGGVT